jgi:hypothetical protein
VSKHAFGSSTFSKTPHAPKVRGSGAYKHASVLSPRQFSQTGTGFVSRVTIGGTRISSSKKGTRVSSGGGGFRMSGSGRLSHRTTIKD